MPMNFSLTQRKYTGCGLLMVLFAAGSTAFAQSEVSIQAARPMPVVGRFLKPFHIEPRIISPPKLTNSPRLQELVRSGNLYLSVQDVIALVLENNLDIAVQRSACRSTRPDRPPSRMACRFGAYLRFWRRADWRCGR